MRFGRFAADGGEPQLGLFKGDRVYEVRVESFEALLSADDGARQEIEKDSLKGRRHDIASVKLLSPLERPSKIICVGINYVPHMIEAEFERPGEPVIFSKLPSALTGPHDPIVLPKAAPGRVDYEAELAIVIGRRGHDVGHDRALEHISGYTVANDVSARDWQVKKPGGQWLLGKSFDTFLPLGPWIVTPDELGDPAARHVRCVVNGETRQDDVLASLIFDFAAVIAYVSQVATLEPGDLILTGTPGGVGSSMKPPRWLQDGDVVETSVDGIGTLRNPVRDAPA